MGEYPLTERDITGPCKEPTHHDVSIAMGEFPIGSFHGRKRQHDVSPCNAPVNALPIIAEEKRSGYSTLSIVRIRAVEKLALPG